VNIRRELSRFWLAISVLWSAVFSTFIAWFILKMTNVWPRRHEWIEITSVATAPWIATGVGRGVKWIIAAFRAAPSN